MRRVRVGLGRRTSHRAGAGEAAPGRDDPVAGQLVVGRGFVLPFIHGRQVVADYGERSIRRRCALHIQAAHDGREGELQDGEVDAGPRFEGDRARVVVVGEERVRLAIHFGTVVLAAVVRVGVTGIGLAEVLLRGGQTVAVYVQLFIDDGGVHAGILFFPPVGQPVLVLVRTVGQIEAQPCPARIIPVEGRRARGIHHDAVPAGLVGADQRAAIRAVVGRAVAVHAVVVERDLFACALAGGGDGRAGQRGDIRQEGDDGHGLADDAVFLRHTQEGAQFQIADQRGLDHVVVGALGAADTTDG